MKQYQALLKKILKEGVEKESGRENMPNTIGLSNSFIEMNLRDGFPLLTTKKMYFKGIVHELLWFLRGDTNIKYLIDNNVHIWDKDAYRWYLKMVSKINHKWYSKILGFKDKHKSILRLNDDGSYSPYSLEEFIEKIKENKLGNFQYQWGKFYKLGDLGKVYGYQWRNQNGLDQIKECLNGLKNNPYSRYHIINGWNAADFPEMALPPCHLLYQFIVRPLSQEEKIQWVMRNTDVEMENLYIYEETLKDSTPKFYLDLNMYQRSCDSFLGVPFNLASMSLLLKIFAKACGMEEGVATWIGGDTHLYKNHVETVKEQLKRKPLELPKVEITKELNGLEDILNLKIDDFKLIDYNSHAPLKAELYTGL